MAMQVNVTGPSNNIGFEGGPPIGLVPGGMPKGTTSPVGNRQVADIALQLADVTIGESTDEPHMSVRALGVEAL